MRKIFYTIVPVLLLCVLIVAGVLLVSHPKADAEAAAPAFSGSVPLDLLQRFNSQLPEISDSPGLPTVTKDASLLPQAVQDVQTFADRAGDSSLAEDLAALTVGYNPATLSYDFMVSFYAPFSGLLSSEDILIPIDADNNYSTGYEWTSLGLGSDYCVFFSGTYSGWTATLYKTPSDNSATWSIMPALTGIQDASADLIFVVVPQSYLGSPLSFRMFVASSYEGYYDTYYDFLPDYGYVTYSRVPATTTTLRPTTTLPPTTTTLPRTTTTTTLPPTTTTTVPAAGEFSDVPVSHPYAVHISDLATRGIINGFPNGTFQPDSWVTRQQFAKMIVKTLNLPVSEADVCPFVDVPSNVSETDPLYPDKYVAVCAAHGITVGKTLTTFAPYDNITRAQLITMVARAAALPEPPSDYSPPFKQYDGTHYPFSRKAAYAGLLNGLQGIGSSFNFFSPATRGEVCLLLFNLLHMQ